jgi:hypothetical protein
VTDTVETRVLPFAAFEKASWDRTDATAIRFPLRGMKFVLNGTQGGRFGTLVLSDLSAVWGELSQHETRSYGDPANACPVLVVDDPDATVLGRDAATDGVLLACKGKAGQRHVVSTVPYVPREVLAALMDEAGVCRYVDSADVIVRADSGLVSLHTAVGGDCELRLPAPAMARNALTRERVGNGTHVRVSLPPSSTTLLGLEPPR